MLLGSCSSKQDNTKMDQNSNDKNTLLLKTNDNQLLIDQYDIGEIGVMQFVSPVKIWKNSQPKELIFDSKSDVIVLQDSLNYNNGILTFHLFKSLGNNQRAFPKLEINPTNKEFKLDNNKNWQNLSQFKPVNEN